MAVEAGTANVEAYVEGVGPAIVLLPSLARDSDDFAGLSGDLARLGFQVIRPVPRGIGQSRGPEVDVTLRDLAADVAATIRAVSDGPAIVLGHAFGNWIARNVAVYFPETARAIVLAAAAARVQPERVRRAVETASDLTKPAAERLAALQSGFFAPGHDARSWLEGWHPAARAIQRAATAASPRDTWWHAGSAPVLDLIAELDPFRPCSTWDENRSEMGDRVTVRVIANASHALIPEQPAAIASAIAEWAAGLPDK
ncbi:MAG: alpha/beta fold hydrolase [Hyphomicrobiaceae bacterium]